MASGLLPLFASFAVTGSVAARVAFSRVARTRRRAEAERQEALLAMAVRAEAGPYRAPAEEEALAPPKRLAKRSAAFMTLLALQFVAPGVVAALLMLLGEDFVALAPCAVAAFAMWCWGPLILARAADEIATERLVAIGALVVGGALLVPPVAHAIFLEVSRADDVRHRCAACPVVWMVLVYAVCTLIQAVLMLASVREYTQTRRPEDEDD